MPAEWINRRRSPIDFLLKEDASFLLLEDDDQIILDQTGSADGLWELRTKN